MKTPTEHQDWSWYTVLSRVGAMQLLGTDVPAHFDEKATFVDARATTDIGMTEEDLGMFRAMAGIHLVEDKAPTRQELEAISFLAIIGEMIEADLSDMIGLDEDAASAIVSKYASNLLNELDITQAAVEARRRGTNRAVMEVAFDPEARRVALESVELILLALVEASKMSPQERGQLYNRAEQAGITRSGDAHAKDYVDMGFRAGKATGAKKQSLYRTSQASLRKAQASRNAKFKFNQPVELPKNLK